jgi:hypothetical protein
MTYGMPSNGWNRYRYAFLQSHPGEDSIQMVGMKALENAPPNG